MAKRKTTSNYIKRAKAVHGNQYDYSQTTYIRSQQPITIICNNHGVFTQAAHNHLAGRGCPDCGKERITVIKPKTQERFVQQAITVHGHLYDYSKTIYEHSHKKIIITCKTHGEFEQVAASHLEGSGCRKCSNDRLPGCYTELKFKTQPLLKDKPAILYFVKFDNENETFFKVGISTRNTQQRFSNGTKHYYNIEEVCSITTTLYGAFIQEQQILQKFKHLKHIPAHKFKGWTECFSADISKLLTP